MPCRGTSDVEPRLARPRGVNAIALPSCPRLEGWMPSAALIMPGWSFGSRILDAQLCVYAATLAAWTLLAVSESGAVPCAQSGCDVYPLGSDVGAAHEYELPCLHDEC